MPKVSIMEHHFNSKCSMFGYVFIYREMYERMFWSRILTLLLRITPSMIEF